MIERNYPKIKEFIVDGQSVLVLGPRGAGKTQFLTQLISQMAHSHIIDLLDSDTFKRFLERPGLIFSLAQELVAKGSAWILIDEVQRLPILLNEVHRTLNKFGDKVCFVLTDPVQES